MSGERLTEPLPRELCPQILGAARPRFGLCPIRTPLLFFYKHNFCVKPYVPRKPKGTQVNVGSMNMGYIFDTARNRTHNLFRPKREPIPLGHCDGLLKRGCALDENNKSMNYQPELFTNSIEL